MSGGRGDRVRGERGEDGLTPTKRTRLEAKALVERFPLSGRTRTKVVRRLVKVVDDPQTTDRDAIAAGKALIAADRCNLTALQLDALRDGLAPKVTTDLIEDAARIRLERARRLGLPAPGGAS
jgi:hypothetical protein